MHLFITLHKKTARSKLHILRVASSDIPTSVSLNNQILISGESNKVKVTNTNTFEKICNKKQKPVHSISPLTNIKRSDLRCHNNCPVVPISTLFNTISFIAYLSRQSWGWRVGQCLFCLVSVMYFTQSLSVMSLKMLTFI